jgi:hypothetical protein
MNDLPNADFKMVDDDIHAYTFDMYGISIIGFRSNFEIIYERQGKPEILNRAARYSSQASGL